MDYVALSDTLKTSKIVLGLWRLNDWAKSPQELLGFTESVLETGITSFDHADIYGNYEVEAEFGKILRLKPELRSRIQIITKCGIMLKSDKYPERSIKHYDTSKEHIIKSAEQSLRNFNTDHIDLLLIHRPDPLMNPEEVAAAFSELLKSGKVLNFGVSNFNASRLSMLQSYSDIRLVTNQIEISPVKPDAFFDGTLDFMMRERITPMAWSPYAGGQLFNPDNSRAVRIKERLRSLSAEGLGQGDDKLALAWLMKHPSGIVPVIGSGNLERIRRAADSVNSVISREDWFAIYEEATGQEVP